jgi:hypothetical protein
MKYANELIMREPKEECSSTWGWSIEENDAMLFRSNILSTSAVWGGSVVHVRWPSDEELSLN